jgi:alpha-1,2-mannosyltransferase
MAGFIDLLRSGAWLTRERMRMVAFALLAASLLGAGYLIATSDGLNDRLGRPLGTDFSNVYTGDLCARRPADGAVRSRTTVRQPVLFRKPVPTFRDHALK